METYFLQSIFGNDTHDTLNQCWLDVGPPSATLAKHQANIDSPLVFAGKYILELLDIIFYF